MWLSEPTLTCILEALVIFSVSEAADIVRCDKSSGVAEVDCLVVAEYFSQLQVQAQCMQRRLEGCVIGYSWKPAESVPLLFGKEQPSRVLPVHWSLII